jgi:drug/metabolite transporter (DMT)-like permease
MVYEAPTIKGGLGPLALVGMAVALQVLGAVLLKVMADVDLGRRTLLLFGFGAVLALDLARFLVWGAAHRRYPLSETFPLSSLFFPAMLVVSLFFGEPVGLRQLAGAALIAAGSAWMRWKAPE